MATHMSGEKEVAAQMKKGCESVHSPFRTRSIPADYRALLWRSQPIRATPRLPSPMAAGEGTIGMLPQLA